MDIRNFFGARKFSPVISLEETNLQEAREAADNTGKAFIDCQLALSDYPAEKMFEFMDKYGGNFRQFVEGLYKRNITYKEVLEEWKYAGGDGRSQNHPDNWDGPSPAQEAHERYFFQTFGHNEYPEWEAHCLCGHTIFENCYIVPRKDIHENCLVIGNCCIRKFMPLAGRTCEECGEGHRNSKRNLCNLCDPAKNKPKGRRGRRRRIT
jgi:hypothetical protein